MDCKPRSSCLVSPARTNVKYNELPGNAPGLHFACDHHNGTVDNRLRLPLCLSSNSTMSIFIMKHTAGERRLCSSAKRPAPVMFGIFSRCRSFAAITWSLFTISVAQVEKRIGYLEIFAFPLLVSNIHEVRSSYEKTAISHPLLFAISLARLSPDSGGYQPRENSDRHGIYQHQPSQPMGALGNGAFQKARARRRSGL